MEDLEFGVEYWEGPHYLIVTLSKLDKIDLNEHFQLLIYLSTHVSAQKLSYKPARSIVRAFPSLGSEVQIPTSEKLTFANFANDGNIEKEAREGPI